MGIKKLGILLKVGTPVSNTLTRPDTRPIPVADGWAGAELWVFTLFDSCSRTNLPTNRPTNGGTDKASYRVARPQLKSRERERTREQ